MRSDNPENIDWIPTVVKHNRAESIRKLVQTDQKKKRYKSLCEKRHSLKKPELKAESESEDNFIHNDEFEITVQQKKFQFRPIWTII